MALCRICGKVLAGGDALELAKDQVTLAYFGGFNSCSGSSPEGLAATDKFNAVKAALEALGKTVFTLKTCYDGMDSVLIRWRASGDPNTYAARWDNPFAEGQIETGLSVMSNGYKRPIYIIGHSYGGWLSSNLVAHVAATNPSGAKAIRGLYTIDAISPYHCNQAGYAGTVAKGVTNRINPWESRSVGGCSASPPQFSKNDGKTYPASIANNADNVIRDLIKGAVQQWRAYYQSLDYLHSSAINDAGGFPYNRFISYSRPFLAGTSSAPHVKIHNDPVVWDDLRAAILRQVTGRAAPRLQDSDEDAVEATLTGTPATQAEMDEPIELAATSVLEKSLEDYFPRGIRGRCGVARIL